MLIIFRRLLAWLLMCPLKNLSSRRAYNSRSQAQVARGQPMRAARSRLALTTKR